MLPPMKVPPSSPTTTNTVSPEVQSIRTALEPESYKTTVLQNNSLTKTSLTKQLSYKTTVLQNNSITKHQSYKITVLQNNIIAKQQLLQNNI